MKVLNLKLEINVKIIIFRRRFVGLGHLIQVKEVKEKKMKNRNTEKLSFMLASPNVRPQLWHRRQSSLSEILR